MDLLQTLIQYVIAHPALTVGAVAALVASYFLLNHKGKLVREAEEHVDRLRRARNDDYKHLRRPH